MVTDSPQGCASLREVTFRSPGHGRGRKGLVLEMDLGTARIGDRLNVLIFGSSRPKGVKVLGISKVTPTGRSYPLLPYELSYIDGRFAVFQLPERKERVMALTRLRWHRDWREAALSALEEGGAESAHLVEGEANDTLREALDRVRAVDDPALLRAERKPDLLEVKTSAPDAFVLVLAQNFMRGWKAMVDGHRVTPFSVNGVLTGVAVPAGEHSVVLKYEPPGLRLGQAMSLASLALFLLLAALVYIYPRRTKRRGG